MPHRFNKRNSKNSFNKRVMKVIHKQAEKKVLDLTESDTSIVSGQPFNLVIGMPAQGDGDNQRNGDQVRLLSLRFRGKLALSASATEGALIRWVIIRVPATNVDGTAPIADFTSMTPNGYYPRELPYKYKVLMDKTLSLHTGGNNMRLVKFNIPVRDQLIQFDGTAVSDISNFKFYILGLTEHATASELSCIGKTRLIYTDI